MVRSLIVVLLLLSLSACADWRLRTTGTAKKDLGKSSKPNYEGKVEIYKDIAIKDIFKGEKTNELDN